ncbi:MAG: Spy/CpxP family protein refolding chaperone [Methylococcaceae bacterium]
MKKQLTALLLALSFSLSAFALEEPKTTIDVPHFYGARIERMGKELGLNEEQKAKLETIFNEEKKKMEVVKKIREETRAKLEEVLTPEQITKMDEIKKQRRHKKPAKEIPESEQE